MADYSREAAHRRYAKAYDIANQAGADSQAAVNEAYRQIYNNTEWTPEEGWADQYAGGPAAYKPASYTSSGSSPLDIVVNAANYTLGDVANDRREEELPSTTTENQDLLSGYENEEQKEEEQKKDGNSPLSPTVSRIVDQARSIENMDDGERFEIARDNFQRSLETQNERTSDAARQTAENQLISQFATAGVNPYDDPLFMQNVSNIRNSDFEDIEDMINEASRRLPETNLLGFTSQRRSDDATRDLYESGFQAENELMKNDSSWADERRGSWGKWSEGQRSQAAPVAVNLAWGSMGFDPNNDPLYQQQIASTAEIPMQSVVGNDAIDDGVHPEARESIYMTGRRYLDYVNNYGIPGRPAEEIDPDAIYSKQDEMENYGFVPYLVSNEGMDRFHDNASMNAVNNVFNDFADLRRNNTSYSFNYDGNTYDGKDFVSKYPAWSKRIINSQEKAFTDPSMVTEDSVPLTWTMRDDVTGEVVYAPSPDGEATTDPETGQPMIDFHTGNPDDNWYFRDYDDMNRSVGYEFAGNGPTYGWRNLEPLILDNGQKIRADKAIDLYDNQNQYANYDKLDIGRPVVNNPIEEGGWLPWIVDMALGSAPLFYAPTAGAQAIGNAYSNFQGFRPGSQNDNNEYQLLSEDPTRLQQLISSSGSAALPATERLWGIGRSAARSAMPFLDYLKRQYPNIAEHPLAILAENAVGEGVEEIPGNLVEEMQNTGSLIAGDYFANPLYYYLDDDGNKVYTTLESNPNNPEEKYRPAFDAVGKRLRDQNTSLVDRNGNFWEEAPLSMLGGSIIGGAAGIHEAAGEVPQYMERKAERDKYGYNIEIPQEVLDYTRRQREGE